jgi:50S ribosomal protein L16 3-hydroxylase
MLPKNLSPEKFLSEYWQKKPLFIKNAFPTLKDPISPEELAGLACEEEVESRLVFNEENTWRLQNGPFTEEDFTSLPNENWSLLVQAVDQWLPKVKTLLTSVSFIPDWRLDDVMVSYATEKAGIGPHFDYYDVIIIQGQGKRHWQLGQHCDHHSALRKDRELKILQDFFVSDEFILEPGDALYIPPGLAHQGTSMNDSLSYSIGFRAPSYSEIISQYAANLCTETTEDQRYSDPDLSPQTNSAELSIESLHRMKSLLLDILQNEQEIEQWFGRYMTQRKYPELSYFPDKEMTTTLLLDALNNGLTLEKHPAARLAFYIKDELICLFADGEIFTMEHNDEGSKALLGELCGKSICQINCLAYQSNLDCISLLAKLYNHGTLIETEELH